MKKCKCGEESVVIFIDKYFCVECYKKNYLKQKESNGRKSQI